MKCIINLISVFTLLSVSICYAASPEEEARFLDAVRVAFTNKDKAAYIKLHCLDGATDKQKESIAWDVDYFLGKDYRVKELRDKDSSPVKTITDITDTTKYSPNLVAHKTLFIEYTGRVVANTRFQKDVGEKDGKLMFVLSVPTK